MTIKSSPTVKGGRPLAPPGAEPSHLRILCLASSINGNISKIRLTTPLSEWVGRHGGTVHSKAFYELSPRDAFVHDIIVIQRECPAHVAQFLKLAKKYGCRIVFEIDDLLTEIPEFLAHHRLGKKQRARLEWVIRFADAISVSTARLAEKIRPHNPKIFITPNYFSPLIQRIPEVSTSPKFSADDTAINLILASSDTITLNFILPALQQLSTESPDHVRIICIGPIGQTVLSHGISCTTVDILPYERFYTFIRSVPNAVGIIPLDTSEFSSCKSAVKYFDYAASRIPTICSNTPPYSDVIENGKTGILVENTTESWGAAMQMLREKNFRDSMTSAAFRHVSANHSISENIDAWSTIFKKIFQDSPEGRFQPYTTPVGTDLLTYQYLMVRSHLRKLNRKRLHATKRLRSRNT